MAARGCESSPFSFFIVFHFGFCFFLLLFSIYMLAGDQIISQIIIICSRLYIWDNFRLKVSTNCLERYAVAYIRPIQPHDASVGVSASGFFGLGISASAFRPRHFGLGISASAFRPRHFGLGLAKSQGSADSTKTKQRRWGVATASARADVDAGAAVLKSSSSQAPVMAVVLLARAGRGGADGLEGGLIGWAARTRGWDRWLSGKWRI
jgi:hypothetical protein